MLPSRILRSTVNAAEISFFSAPFFAVFIRQKLLETARDEDETASQNVLKDLQVLDVGCGGGLLSESLARLGARTVGIDASESNIEIAKHHASTDSKLSENLSYMHTSAESLLSQPKRYDVVCSMEVLEHVDNPALFLSTCAQLPQGLSSLNLTTDLILKCL
ncbi:S-adenosyl-L-methionine-dependent methyltransferase [Desarmillaria tabescens]|uniref:S-adenosyl-L-methionine-dependent methyltransferase n=1 Tax=Armillaria tabescens TaxID=1929756 RepID=A0AA39NK21_ARMTA|nr:S-adenosyl-L-methionine-dependent methyltransferase [Desarmillaria tabescens]KAK0467050.1 S-adenosyl-L-methionine-dependent methyltransferase [Desarmillaria tabescens]